jgi:hypothetical protein
MWDATKPPIESISYRGGTITIAQSTHSTGWARPLPRMNEVKWRPPRDTPTPAAGKVIESPPTERNQVHTALVAAGLSLPATSAPVAGKLTPEQREELARRISVGTPLSQIIIEERSGR